MDPVTRSAREALAARDGEKSEATNACLRTKCAAELTKCLGRSGPCQTTILRKQARGDCRSVAKESFIRVEGVCKSQCLTQAQGLNSSAQALAKLRNEPPFTVKDMNDIQKEKYKECRMECQSTKALETIEYKECFAFALEKYAASCAVVKCVEKIDACMSSRCGSK